MSRDKSITLCVGATPPGTLTPVGPWGIFMSVRSGPPGELRVAPGAGRSRDRAEVEEEAEAGDDTARRRNRAVNMLDTTACVCQ